MPRADRIIVHLVSADERVRQAARSLPPDRFDVSFSGSAQEALAWVMQNPPEVAVMELHIGDYGGFALAKDFRNLPSLANLPLVMLCERPHDRWLCHQAGAAQVLVKPLSDPSILLDALEAALAPAR